MKSRAKWLLPAIVLLCLAGQFAFGLLLDLKQETPAKPEAEPTAAETGEPRTDAVEKEQPDDTHLRDNPLLYENEDPTSVITMYLTVSSGNEADGTNHTWTEINTYSAYDYVDMGVDRYKVDGLLQIDETGDGVNEDSFGYDETEPNVTVQVRGQTSSRQRQKNYKIRIKKDCGAFREQRTLNLNKHVGEALRFVNKLSYDLLNTIPQLVGGRTQFVHLYVRDLTSETPGDFVDYGLYTMVEQVNRTYLRNHLLDENGQLYKVTFYEWDEYEAVMMDQDDPEFDRSAFERYLEIKGSEDHTKLQRATADVKNYLKPIRQIVDEYFDAENICYWMAFNILIGNYDSSARNLFLYSPMNSEKFYMIPWDLDASFRRDYLDMREHHEGESWERGMQLFLGVSLVNRMMREEEYRDMLTAAVVDLYTNYLSPDIVQARANALSTVTKQFLFGEYSAADYPNSPIRDEATYDALLSQVGSQVERNYQYYLDSLDNPWPFYVDVPELDTDNNELILSWGVSYDIHEEPVTYEYILATDYLFENVIVRQEGLSVPTVTIAPLEPGTYFLRVRATNASGRSTDCFDYYSTHAIGKAYGCFCFVVREDGTAKAHEGSVV